jgi:hypothetical protein
MRVALALLVALPPAQSELRLTGLVAKRAEKAMRGAS